MESQTTGFEPDLRPIWSASGPQKRSALLLACVARADALQARGELRCPG